MFAQFNESVKAKNRSSLMALLVLTLEHRKGLLCPRTFRPFGYDDVPFG
jgi:hypothetical protein